MKSIWWYGTVAAISVFTYWLVTDIDVVHETTFSDHAPGPRAVPSKPAPLLKLNGKQKKTETAESKFVPRPLIPPAPKKILQINLSNSIVSRMEDDWNNLPKHAEAKREQRGWRMIRVDNGSLFAHAGLQEGDLVTTEFLDKLRTSDDQLQLMLRVQQILNRITR